MPLILEARHSWDSSGTADGGPTPDLLPPYGDASRPDQRPDRYRGCVSSPRVPGGVVHKLPGDLRQALIANATALDAWKDITPLARNEFICWVEEGNDCQVAPAHD